MNYIYDILLNFKDQFYDFYDWNKNDNIMHIRKIPIFRIDKQNLYDIKINNIKFNISFLEKIENKTEMFTNNGIKKIKSMFLLSDGESIVGINVVQKKNKISSLLIDEELDSLEDVYTMDIEDIEYSIIKKNTENALKTRKQIENEKFIKKELEKILNNEEKLKYLYYECFDKKEENIDKIVVKLSNFDDEKVVDKVYKFLNLIKVHK